MKRHECVSFTTNLYDLYVKLAYNNNSFMLLFITHMLASLESNTPLNGCCFQTQDWAQSWRMASQTRWNYFLELEPLRIGGKVLPNHGHFIFDALDVDPCIYNFLGSEILPTTNRNTP